MNKNKRYNKSLYSYTENNITISIQLYYNSKTDHIGIYSGIYSGFSKHKKIKIIKCKVCNELKHHTGHGLCRKCYDKQRYDNLPTSGGAKTNKNCASYLGCTIAEQILSHVFKNVEKMPCNNSGYDFICGKGFKIDVKSSCRDKREKRRGGWQFSIRYNTIADYFLCIAFDNREDLNPEHIWLIPGSNINDKKGAAISESTLNKWSKYELNRLDDIITCCNIFREFNRNNENILMDV